MTRRLRSLLITVTLLLGCADEADERPLADAGAADAATALDAGRDAAADIDATSRDASVLGDGSADAGAPFEGSADAGPLCFGAVPSVDAAVATPPADDAGARCFDPFSVPASAAIFTDALTGCACEETPEQSAGYCVTLVGNATMGTGFPVACRSGHWTFVPEGCGTPLLSPEECRQRGGVEEPGRRWYGDCAFGEHYLGSITDRLHHCCAPLVVTSEQCVAAGYQVVASAGLPFLYDQCANNGFRRATIYSCGDAESLHCCEHGSAP